MAAITIRRLEDADKDHLRRAARREGISMEEYVRRLIMKDRDGEAEPETSIEDILQKIRQDYPIPTDMSDLDWSVERPRFQNTRPDPFTDHGKT